MLLIILFIAINLLREKSMPRDIW